MSLPQTVFIVDDEAIIRDSLLLLLEQKNYNVECFASAEEFLGSYDPSSPGCLITDVQMPGMSGLELQEQLIELRANMPAIVTSGGATVAMVVRAFELGAVDFLEKPISPDHFLESIEQAMAVDADRRMSLAHFLGESEIAMELDCTECRC